MRNIKNIWLPTSTVTVFVDFTRDGKTIFAAKIRDYPMDEMIQFSQFETIEHIISHFGKRSLYQLHVLGLGVITREVRFQPNFKEELIIGAKQEDFFFCFFSDGENVISSFFRKNLIELELDTFKKNRINVLQVSSGEIPLINLLNENDSFSGNYKLKLDGGKIVHFEKNDSINKNNVEWSSKIYDRSDLIAKALFLHLDVTKRKYETDFNGSILTELAEYKSRKKFNVFGGTLISTIFLLLVVNYFYMNSLNQQIVDLESELLVSQDNLALLERLNQEKSRKEQLVISAGVTSKKFLAYYLDEIVSVIPNPIKLQTLIVFPVTSKIKNKSKVEIDQTRIEITGITQHNEVLDEWIEKMDRFDWIKGIELQNYLKNESGFADFKLIIRLAS